MMIRLRDRRTWVGKSTEAGAIALITAVLIPVLLILVAFAADIGRWYVEVAKVQKAADAAALAGVTWLPSDINGGTVKAGAVAALNGYTDADGLTFANLTSQGVGFPQVQVTNSGLRPSELLVTVTSQITNSFARIFGLQTTRISRSALADYVAPAIMGSPCNAIGNQPPSNASGNTPNPPGTVIPGDGQGGRPAQGGYQTCQSDPNFWTAIEGPATSKIQGDRYATRNCSGGTIDGCRSSSSTDGNVPATPPVTGQGEYNEANYYFVIRVGQAALNRPINVQIYDPAYVSTGQTCTALDTPSSGRNGTGFYDGMNPYVTNDWAARYSDSDGNDYCPGDNDPGGGGTTNLTTSFILRDQIPTQDPDAAVPIPGCTKQFGSYDGTPRAENLRDRTANYNIFGTLTGYTNNNSYNPALAKVFHQWVELCTFTPTVRGDYYLQVRTNKGLAAAEPNLNPYTGNDMGALISSNAAAADPASDAAGRAGHGSNGFAIRAFVDGCDSSASAGQCTAATNVSVAGYERMPIFMNVNDDATFNLLQVLPNAAGQKIFFEFFDGGDASGSGTVRVLPPVSYSGSALGGCTGTGPSTVNSANCSVTVSGSNNGRTQLITVQIPNNYSCPASGAATPGDCWYRVNFDYPTGTSVHDFTTWNANLGGDPVRLLR